MKTQEEIKQMANEWAVNNAEISFAENSSLNKGYIKGYNQCQEDMADVIASLKEQLREFQSKEPKYAVEGDYCAVCGCTEFWNDEE